MAGFSSITGDESIMFADNASFDGTQRGGKMTTNGQLWIGSTASPHVKLGVLTSPNSSITIGYSSPNITLVAGSAIPLTFTGDSGVAAPVANNLNIFGRSGSKTAATGSTVTVNSPPYANQAGSTTVTLNSGSFATAAITLTTPASAGLLDGDLLEFVATNGVLVIQLAATQVAHVGTIITSVAGTITSTNTGDSLSLRYQVSTNDWWATSVIGTWVLA
jgi:hypothetical protein